MQGLKVKCPNCGRTDFITTEKFDPTVTPNGGMVKCTLPYYIDWLCSSTTLCAEMTCPECLAQLAPSGVLNVMVPPRLVGEFYRALFPEDSKEILGGSPEELSGPVEISKSVQKRLEAQGALICPVCNDGRVFKSQIALNGHMKKHEKGK